MNNTLRTALLALAVAATSALVLTTATIRGETKEAATIDETCAHAAWPNIPSQCLDGAIGNSVRMVSTDRDLPQVAMQLRFETAFQ